MKKVDLSIIIVSYNTKSLLDKCLKSVYQSLTKGTFSYELIVVDNASTDDSQRMIEKKYPQVHLLKNTSNVGFGRANNQGISQAKGHMILFLNSDIEVIGDAIVKLYQFSHTLPVKSAVGGKLFNSDKSPQPSCGPAYSLLNIFTALFFKGDYLNFTRYSPSLVKKVDWIMGACMLIPRLAFKEVGGFDEGIFMYMEEIDWQYRAQKKGYQIYFYPESHFMHVGAGSSTGRATPILNVFRGFLYYYKKHYNNWNLYILRVILVTKSLVAVGLFTVLNKKDDQKLYKEAFKIAMYK